MSLFSRVFFAWAAAVVPFIMDLHAAQAYPTVAPLDSGQQPFWRSHKRLGLLSSGAGRLTDSAAAQNWRDQDRDAPPVPHLQPNLLRNGHSGYSPNTQPDEQPMRQVRRGQHLGGAMQAGGTSTHSDPQLSGMNHNPSFRSQSQNSGPSGFVASHNGNSQPWHLPIMRKSSQPESPFPQRSASHVHTAYENDQIPRSGSSAQPESRSEGKIDWKSPENPMSLRSSGYWSSQAYSKVHSSDNTETNAGAGAVNARQHPSFLNQRSFIVASVSSSKDSSVNKPEKLTSTITQFSPGEFPPNGNEKTSYKRVQSSLLRHSHTSDAPGGVNAPNSHHNANKGLDFDQQTRANLKSANKGNHSSSVILKSHKNNPLIPYDNTDSAVRNAQDAESGQVIPSNENDGRLKELVHLNKGLLSWSTSKKNSQSLMNAKEANFESSTYRLVRPSRLQKYSFEQRVANSPSSREISRQPSSALLDATTQNSSPAQEYGPQSAEDINVERPGAFSGAGQNELKSLAESANVSRSVSLTGVEPQGNTQWKDGVAKDLQYEAVTYDDVIGSASFSSVIPAKTVQDGSQFEKSSHIDGTGVMEKTVHSSHTSGTKENSVGGKTFNFRKGEAETELGISDGSVAGKESEAKSVPHGRLSDAEENIESDSLLELDYLRTSTGNVSFHSLNQLIQ